MSIRQLGGVARGSLALAMIFGAGATSSAAYDQDCAPEIVGSLYGAGEPHYVRDVAVVGGAAFATDHLSLLSVDVSDPLDPVIIGSVSTPDEAVGVAVAGGVACVTLGESGLLLIDISDPADPTILGSVDTPGWAAGVATIGGIAYVADGSSGLQVIDVSDPSSADIIGSLVTPDHAGAVALSGTLAYVTVYDSGLQVIDVSDPSQPVSLGLVDTPDSALDVAVRDDVAYVTDRWVGLQVIDVSEPSNPLIIATVLEDDLFDRAIMTQSVAVSGDLAYVTGRLYWADWVSVVNISDPPNPTVLGSIEIPVGRVRGVTAHDDMAYVADGRSGLLIINASVPASPAIVGSVAEDIPGSLPFRVAINGNTAYGLDGGLEVIDVSKPEAPVLVDVLVPDWVDCESHTPREINVTGSMAYLLGQWEDDDECRFNELAVLDASDPTKPSLRGTLGGVPGSALQVADTVAYLAGFPCFGLGCSFTFQTIDVDDPSNPIELGAVHSLGLQPEPVGLAANAGVASVVGVSQVDDDGRLILIDVADPSDPLILSETELPFQAVSISMRDGVAFVVGTDYAGDTGWLASVDLTDPASPTIVSLVATPAEAAEVALNDDRAFVTDSLGVHVIDVSDLSEMVLIGSIETSGAATDVALEADAAYVADEGYGLRVIDVSTCLSCPGDIDGDGLVSFIDLLNVLMSWGPCEDCPADLNGDGVVNFMDLLTVLANWGPCP